MPRANVDVTAGRTKWGRWKGYQRRGSAVEPTEPGVAPLGSQTPFIVGSTIWQRNSTPPVGVPLGQPTGVPWKLQVTFRAEPEYSDAEPLKCQPSSTCRVKMLFQCWLTSGIV